MHSNVRYNMAWSFFCMRVITSKSKNAESFYISKGYINNKGVSTSTIIRKLGTLQELLKEHGPTRDDVMAWAKEEVRLATLKYKEEQQSKSVQITFHANRQLDYEQQVFYRGGYLFLQSIYYSLALDKICRKLRDKYKFKYDINAILSDMIFARILEPSSKRSSLKVAFEFGCQKFIYCSDAGLGSEKIRNYNHMGERAFIVTQSIKKLNAEDKECALNGTGFKRVSDDTPVDISKLPADDTGLYYKEEPYTPKTLHQQIFLKIR